MPEPLLTRDCQQLIEQAQIDFLSSANERLMIAQLEGIFMRIDPLSYSVLKYLLLHLKDISETKGKMIRDCRILLKNFIITQIILQSNPN